MHFCGVLPAALPYYYYYYNYYYYYYYCYYYYYYCYYYYCCCYYYYYYYYYLRAGSARYTRLRFARVVLRGFRAHRRIQIASRN